MSYDMEFEKIILRPMSYQILSYLVDHAEEPPKRSTEIAEDLKLTPTQVDAAITKTLVRWNFAHREAKLTNLRKKLYNIIVVTKRGKNYIEWMRDKNETE